MVLSVAYQDSYSKALEPSPIDDVEAATVRLNRALMFLKTHRFDAALCDFENTSAESKPSKKVLSRKVQAFYHL